MCNKEYDIASIVVSLVVGVGFAVLIRFFPALYRPGFFFAAALGALVLLLVAIAASSLLRQDKRLNDCVCETGKKTLIPAIVLLAFSLPSALMYLLDVRTTIIFPIFSFVLYALISYTLFSLYCFLACLVSAGCRCNVCGE